MCFDRIHCRRDGSGWQNLRIAGALPRDKLGEKRQFGLRGERLYVATLLAAGRDSLRISLMITVHCWSHQIRSVRSRRIARARNTDRDLGTGAPD